MAISPTAISYMTQSNTSWGPFPDLQCSPLLVSSLVQNNPQGVQRLHQAVHYFFPRARLDLQFLTICAHIGYICWVQESLVHSVECRIFLRDCSSFIKKPHDQNNLPNRQTICTCLKSNRYINTHKPIGYLHIRAFGWHNYQEEGLGGWEVRSFS